MTRRTILAAAASLALIAACSGGDDTPDFARQACEGVSSPSLCEEQMRELQDHSPGQLIAICEYDTGRDIVLIEVEAEAETACSADGLMSPSRVVETMTVPAR